MTPASAPDHLIGRLKAAGIDGVDLVSHTADDVPFGDEQTIVRVGPLLLRVVRDRGQEFLDLGAIAAPDRFHFFEDIEVALGWATLDAVLARRAVEDLDQLLARLSRRLEALMHAFSDERERLTRARVDRAAHERGRALTENQES